MFNRLNLSMQSTVHNFRTTKNYFSAIDLRQISQGDQVVTTIGAIPNANELHPKDCVETGKTFFYDCIQNRTVYLEEDRGNLGKQACETSVFVEPRLFKDYFDKVEGN